MTPAGHAPPLMPPDVYEPKGGRQARPGFCGVSLPATGMHGRQGAVPRPWTQADAQAFAEEMADLMGRHPEQARGIYLAMPFCGVRPTSLGARVFHGRSRDCGPFAALNVNAQGRLQACFEVGEMEGLRSLAEIRDCPEIRACALVEALPSCGPLRRRLPQALWPDPARRPLDRLSGRVFMRLSWDIVSLRLGKFVGFLFLLLLVLADHR